jgi:hypothetical protein
MTATVALKNDRRIGAPSVTSRQKTSEERAPRVRPKWNLIERQQYEAEIAQLKNRVHEMETAIMSQKREKSRALSIYGSQNALEELTQQVGLSPKFADLSPAEHRYVASVALASGLNPEFHLHAWKQDKWTGKGEQRRKVEVLTVFPDYKALIVASPDPIMVDEQRLTEAELRERGVTDKQLADGTIGYKVIGTNLKHAIMARQAGIEYKPFIGYGIWYGSGDKSKSTPTAGRDGAWDARRRGFRDLYNQVADLRLEHVRVSGAQSADDGWAFSNDDVVYGEFEEVEREPDGWQDETDGAITRAESYRDSKGVTDDEINADLDCEDWRKSPCTPQEFKIVVDQIAVKKAIAAAPAKADVQAEPVFSEEETEKTAEIPAIFDEPDGEQSVAKTRRAPIGDQAEEVATKCVKCEKNAPTGEEPFPFLCADCARAAGDEEAVETAA